jgi:UDP-GlcNAc:undecaprenyl-phosphate GlcNAc-1-phosphate transferase
MEWVLLIIFSFVSAAILIPSAKMLGKRCNIVDRPGERKIHDAVVPCTGGFALFAIYLFSALFLLFFCPGNFGGAAHSCLVNTTAALVVIGLLGVFDDVRGANAKVKFLFQAAAALIVMNGGIVLDRILIPYDGSFATGIFGYPLTLLWIVGITNAYNLIDGLDGLACAVVAGVAAVISVIGYGNGNLLPATFAAVNLIDGLDGLACAVVAGVAAVISVIGYGNGNLLPATFAAVIAVSSFAFYYYNRHPAKVFLGDTGSLLMGFLIAVTSIECLRSPDGSVAFFPMIVLNGLVIGDTIIVIIVRLISKKSPFSGDLNHVHHRMLRHTGSIKTSVRVILAVNVLFIICGIALLYEDGIKVATSTLLFSKSAREILAVLLNLSGRGSDLAGREPE